MKRVFCSYAVEAMFGIWALESLQFSTRQNLHEMLLSWIILLKMQLFVDV